MVVEVGAASRGPAVSRDAESLLSRAEALIRAPDTATRAGAARVRKAVAEHMASLQNLFKDFLVP